MYVLLAVSAAIGTLEQDTCDQSGKSSKAGCFFSTYHTAELNLVFSKRRLKQSRGDY